MYVVPGISQIFYDEASVREIVLTFPRFSLTSDYEPTKVMTQELIANISSLTAQNALIYAWNNLPRLKKRAEKIEADAKKVKALSDSIWNDLGSLDEYHADDEEPLSLPECNVPVSTPDWKDIFSQSLSITDSILDSNSNINDLFDKTEVSLSIKKDASGKELVQLGDINNVVTQTEIAVHRVVQILTHSRDDLEVLTQEIEMLLNRRVPGRLLVGINSLSSCTSPGVEEVTFLSRVSLNSQRLDFHVSVFQEVNGVKLFQLLPIPYVVGSEVMQIDMPQNAFYKPEQAR
jgi:hypothetical protein